MHKAFSDYKLEVCEKCKITIGFVLASTSIASFWRISGGKLAANERLGLMLGNQGEIRRTSIQANPISPKVLPVIEPGRNQLIASQNL